MQLTDQLIEYIESAARRKGWINAHTNEVSIAELARNSNFTEATWSRIMRKKQATIKDKVAAEIGKMFGASPVEMLMVSIGENPENNTHTSPEGTSLYTKEQVAALTQIANAQGLSLTDLLRKRADEIIQQARDFKIID